MDRGILIKESSPEKRLWSPSRRAGCGREQAGSSEGRTPLPSLESPSTGLPAPSPPPALPALRILGQAKTAGRLTATRGRANRR